MKSSCWVENYTDMPFNWREYSIRTDLKLIIHPYFIGCSDWLRDRDFLQLFARLRVPQNKCSIVAHRT